MFELLSEPVRRYIRDRKWESLRPIQAASIKKVLQTDENLILASKTASGKTEAAFLPILSKVNFNEAGVQVLYVSPLIALINDQFNRVEELCSYLEVPVTKWHGEASRSLKDKLIKNPKGVVLITPESIEAMLVNAPYQAKHLFENLKFIVIDEIHSFLGTDRGIQLQSLLSRLQFFNNLPIRIIGLSATIGDYGQAKKMTGRESETKVLIDKAAKEIESQFKFFEMEGNDLPLDLLKDLYLNTKDSKVLIFPNSRGRAEEVAVKLQKIAERVGGHAYYFSHHSSVDKELREYIEQFAKTNVRFPFAIACTSTLELGIDIGSVDMVVQIDAAHSIASMIQRIGRSGRRDNESSKLTLYATDRWNLLQSAACMTLYREGFIEPVPANDKPYDILLHQSLALVKQLSGCRPNVLVERLRENFAFSGISEEEIQEIIQHLIQTDLLELIGGELIIGVEGERIVNGRDFYSVFKTEPVYKVIHQDKAIGEIPLTLQIQVNENILLAARIWKIIDVDTGAKKITVVPAKDGKKPLFMGSGPDIHPKIRERMLELLMQSTALPDMNEAAREAIRQMKSEFDGFNIESLEDDRPVKNLHTEVVWYTFHGSKVNRTIKFLLSLMDVDCGLNEHESSMTFKLGHASLKSSFSTALGYMDDIDFYLENVVRENPRLLDFSKWGQFLPIAYQVHLLKNKYFDFSNANVFLANVIFSTKNE